MPTSNASAVNAFSPPESNNTFCNFLPGGDATTSMPLSAVFNSSVKRMKAWPPPNSLRKVNWKFSLMRSKASWNFCRENSSISLMVAWVFSMDSRRSLRWVSRNSWRCAVSLYSSSAIMLTGPILSSLVRISRYAVSSAISCSPSTFTISRFARRSAAARFSSFRQTSPMCARSDWSLASAVPSSALRSRAASNSRRAAFNSCSISAMRARTCSDSCCSCTPDASAAVLSAASASRRSPIWAFSAVRCCFSAAAEKQQRTAENAQIGERLEALAAERTAAEASGVQLQHESEQVRARIAEIEQELKAARLELDAARERKAELGTALAKLQSDLAHMGEVCLNELNLAAADLRANLEIVKVEGEQLVAEEAAYREMRTRLDNMGPVNMMALEEYKETAQRHEFLETQRKDLLESIENTQATIKEIDEFSRQKFQEAFERINENFQFTFRKLFGGGQAFMRLTDELNTAESGIDVVASPPGKKLQNVLLLSGGEKALTALSLLVGIFQYQTSPFCILDEVDAPLDEANIGRFTELIKDMAVETQFIIITHSKKTMAVAPVMYGVTMQEPGVSKVVSVKFGHEAGPRAVSA